MMLVAICLVISQRMRLSGTLRRYSVSKIMGSRLWPFGVTWLHRSRDHSTPGSRLSIGGP